MDKFENSNSLNNLNIQNNQTKKQKQKQIVIDLFEYSEKGEVELLRKLTDDYEFSGITLNLAFRKLIFRYNYLKTNYQECLKILLNSNIDINYQYSEEKNSTILMKLINKNDLDLIIKVFNYYNDNSNKEGQKVPINFTLLDDKKRNFIFYGVKKLCNQTDTLEILEYFYNNFENQNIIKYLLSNKDIKGNTFLGKAIKKGWSELVNKLYNYMSFQQSVNNDKNNYLHLAVLSKSILCLKIVLLNSKIDDIKQKNNESLTPYQFANKKGYYLIAKIIHFYNGILNNQNNQSSFSSFKQYFIGIFKGYKGFNLIDLIDYFQKDQFEFVQFLLEQYDLYQSFLNSDIINNNNEIDQHLYSSIKWNLLLCKYQMNFNNNFTTEGDGVFSFNIKSQKDIINNYDLFKDFELFFKEYLNNNYINNIYNLDNNHNICSLEELPNLDIAILNKLIFYSKIKESIIITETLDIYIQKILPINDNSYYKWIALINSSLILIDILIYYNYKQLALIIINNLESLLFNFYGSKTYSSSYTSDNQRVCMYLNEIGLFNQYTNTWEETFCYLNLLKAMCNIELADKSFEHYNYLISKSKYINDLKIFRDLNIFYFCLNIHMAYFKNDINQCLKKLENFKKEKLLEEEKIFYYNAIGIIYMKKGKYFTAEIHFIIAIKIYQDLLSQNNFLQIRLEFVYILQYNLALCFFFQHKFIQARNIFIKLSKINLFKYSINLWYRLGLCELEIELQKTKYLKEYNDLLYDSKIINNNQNNNQNNNHKFNNYDCISISLNDDEDNNEIDTNIISNLNTKQNSKNKNKNGIKHKSVNSHNDNNKRNISNNSDNNNNRSHSNNVNKYSNKIYHLNNKIENLDDNEEEIDDDVDELYLQFEKEYGDINILKDYINAKNIKNPKYNYYIDTNQKDSIKEKDKVIKFILKTKKIKRKNSNINNNTINNTINNNIPNFNDAIFAFKQVIFIENFSIINKNTISNFLSFYCKDNNLYNEKMYYDRELSETNNQMFIKSLLNLLYCLSLKEDYLNLLYYINAYESKYINKFQEYKNEIESFRIEALIKLKKYNEALNKIKQLLNSNNNDEEQNKMDLFLKYNFNYYNNFTFKNNLLYGLILINIKKNNFSEVDKYSNILCSYYLDNNEIIPSPLIIILLYIQLIKFNNHSDYNTYTNIINILKLKRFNHLRENKSY